MKSRKLPVWFQKLLSGSSGSKLKKEKLRAYTLTVVSLRDEKMPTKFPPPPTPPPSSPSLHHSEEEDHHHELEGVAAVTYRIVLPTISVLGLAGNLLSILGKSNAILTQKSIHRLVSQKSKTMYMFHSKVEILLGKSELASEIFHKLYPIGGHGTCYPSLVNKNPTNTFKVKKALHFGAVTQLDSIQQ